MGNIVGREPELTRLEKIYKSDKAEFIAVYGRRRIGKTFLISEFFKDKGYYFELTGTKDAPVKAQLNNFAEEFADTFYNGEQQPTPKTWQAAFTQLRKAVQQLDPDKKVILFFDELPWLASRRSKILPTLEHTWNRYLSRHNNVIVIVCGSAASWMLKKIIYNKGGLYGRLTAEMHLKPFTLAETEQYLNAKNVFLDRKQIIEIYLAFGGVAKYLANIEKGKSAAQIINEVCFARSGALKVEFPKLFASLFENPQQHMTIVKALATKRHGMTQAEILQSVGLRSGGGFSRILSELESSGFIMSCTEFGKKKKESKYRLIDEYALFYLSWINPATTDQMHNVATDYWLRMCNSQAYLAWAGYAFEGICLKHVDKIIEALKISVVAKAYSTWSFMPQNGDIVKGAQIDLVLDRNDNCINLCELKFYNSEYVIDKDYADALNYKKTCFMRQTKTTKSLFTTMVTTYGVSENKHYLAAVDNQVKVDALF